MKVAITGGAGFIGKWLVRQMPTNSELILIDSLDSQVHRTKTDFTNELKQRAHCIRADIRDQDAYAKQIEGVDVVVHLASQTGTGQSMYEISRYVQQNIEGTARLLEVLSRLSQKPQRIVLTSSRAVYGEGAFTNGSVLKYNTGRCLEDLQTGKWEVYDEVGQELYSVPMKEDQLTHPTSVYGLTKLWQEQLIENYAKSQGIDYVFFRLQNVYGPEQELHNPYTGIIGIFTSLIVQKGEVELFEDGKMTRDFVYVKDVANALIQGVYHPNLLSRIINVGSGIATSLAELVQLIAAAAAQKNVSIEYQGRFRIGDIRHAIADMNCYEQTFGSWNPTPLAAGIQAYLQWYLGQNPLSSDILLDSFQEMQDKNLLLKRK